MIRRQNAIVLCQVEMFGQDVVEPDSAAFHRMLRDGSPVSGARNLVSLFCMGGIIAEQVNELILGFEGEDL